MALSPSSSRGAAYLTATTTIWYHGQKSQCTRRMRLSQRRCRRAGVCSRGAITELPARCCRSRPPGGLWLECVHENNDQVSSEGGSLRSAGTMLKQIYYVTLPGGGCVWRLLRPRCRRLVCWSPGISPSMWGFRSAPPAAPIAALSAHPPLDLADWWSPYLQALSREIQAVGQMLASSGLRARTPLYRRRHPHHHGVPAEPALDLIDRSLDLTGRLEYTVEAGRPDTITQEKLQVLARHGVGRVSINPQSMDDRVLALCGRRHKAPRFPRASGWPGRRIFFH